MTAPLLSEAEIARLVEEGADAEGYTGAPSRAAVEAAIRQAVKLAGEEAVKTCDEVAKGRQESAYYEAAEGAEWCASDIRERL